MHKTRHFALQSLFFWAGGMAPLPDPSPRRETSPPHTLPDRRLDPRAFGARPLRLWRFDLPLLAAAAE